VSRFVINAALVGLFLFFLTRGFYLEVFHKDDL
jgi:hypothetical protein